MKKRSFFIPGSGISIFLTLLFIGLFLSMNEVYSQRKNKNRAPDLKLALTLNSMYDDNILKYSDKYIDRFLNKEDEGRFHINTYDDVVWSPEIEFTSTARIFKKLNTTLNGGYRFTSYTVNNSKNRNYFYIGLRQLITKKASIRLSYSYIPDFYVRHFRDDDWVNVYGYTPATFKPFSFSKDSYSFEIQNTFFKNTRLRLLLNYAAYFYNGYFTEYDCNNKSIDVNLRQPLGKKLRIEAAYSFTASTAKGYDQPGENRGNSDDADGSYDEDGFLIKLRYQLPDLKKHKQSIEVSGEFGKRYFTSDKFIELDPLHAGRVDNNFDFNAAYTFEISKKLEFSIFYSRLSRESTSAATENREYISEEKDYKQNQAGISITYNLKVL